VAKFNFCKKLFYPQDAEHRLLVEMSLAACRRWVKIWKAAAILYLGRLQQAQADKI
jgi:hypothetical protein